MDSIEIYAYEGVGYNRTFSYGEWRVAIANYAEHFDKEKYTYLERHLLTDEVFVLLSGKATLITDKEFTETPLEIGKIYNVKKGSWHALWLDEDSKVLIVENNNTTKENTEYYYFK